MRRLNLTETGYAFPMQLWPQVWHAQLRITELPVRLIYNDPTRHFGGILDDAAVRLRHYKGRPERRTAAHPRAGPKPTVGRRRINRPSVAVSCGE